MTTATAEPGTAATPEDKGTQKSDGARSPEETPKTPQQLHEAALAEAAKKQETPSAGSEEGKPAGDQPPAGDQKLIFGKYKTIEEAEKAHNESVARMNETQRELSAYQAVQAKAATQGASEQGVTKIVDGVKKKFVDQLGIKEEVANEMVAGIDQIVRSHFDPLIKELEKNQVINELADLHARHSDFQNYESAIKEMISKYPVEMRRHLDLEDLYHAAKSKDPSVTKMAADVAAKKAEEEALKTAQLASRTSVVASKGGTGVTTAGGEKVWTRADIAKLSSAEYTKYESQILRQMNGGQIK